MERWVKKNQPVLITMVETNIPVENDETQFKVLGLIYKATNIRLSCFNSASLCSQAQCAMQSLFLQGWEYEKSEIKKERDEGTAIFYPLRPSLI